ncbi:ABC transporter permease [Salinibacterium soli]|uniref:ABC transporter permease n=1 Tax=Antiquaquibacter soli TaxID=3064523 RepID=A0ABT9BMA1_9MICO|nr:ABC transporter permease [Protaetiibacter sp. WY-16]MDO7881557.1 ABC transporter permease [Protaetiibacter sp. WY-16]
MTTQLDSTATEPVRPARRRRRLPDTAALAVVLVALAIFFSTQSPFYLTPNNLLNILVNAAVIGIIAAPGTLLLVAGQFDLSVGSGAAFIGVVMAWSATQWGIPTAVLLALAAGLVIGMVNGFAVTVLGINALITTLATLAILRGLGQVIAGGQTLLLSGFGDLGNARPFLDIPVPVLILVAVVVVMALVMRFTVFGRSMYAIGANPVAARLAGIRTRTMIFGGFLLSGLAVSVGGLILVSQLGAASPNAAMGLELSVVTAVILGGASLAGGRGTILGTVLGVLILGTLNNGLTLMNIDSFWQDVARGVLLLAAVGFDQLRLRFLSDK